MRKIIPLFDGEVTIEIKIPSGTRTYSFEGKDIEFIEHALDYWKNNNNNIDPADRGYKYIIPTYELSIKNISPIIVEDHLNAPQ